MLLPESKSYHLSAAGELRPCAAYSDPSVRESPVFPNRKLRECAAFACSCGGGRPGNPVPSHSLSDISFSHTDIGRAQSDLFSSRVKTFSRQSAAFRVIVSSFFTNFFIAGGRAFRQAVVVILVWVRLLGYVPLFSGYSNYLFDRCSITRSGCGAKRLFPAFINYFLFSGDVRPVAANGSQGVRPFILWLYEQFFHNNIRLGGLNSGAFTGTFRSFGLFLCLPL